MKRYWLILLTAGLVAAILGVLGPAFFMPVPAQETAGIIGGADMPTYLLLLSTSFDGLFFYLLFFGVCLIIAALMWWLVQSIRN